MCESEAIDNLQKQHLAQEYISMTRLGFPRRSSEKSSRKFRTGGFHREGILPCPLHGVYFIRQATRRIPSVIRRTNQKALTGVLCQVKTH